MQNIKRGIIGAAIAAAIAISFFAGSCITKQEQAKNRLGRCDTLILSAIDKAENGSLSDPGVAKALISNVYAACLFCDDPDLSAQLHDLWNTLIFEGDGLIGNEDSLADELRGILEAVRAKR